MSYIEKTTQKVCYIYCGTDANPIKIMWNHVDKQIWNKNYTNFKKLFITIGGIEACHMLENWYDIMNIKLMLPFLSIISAAQFRKITVTFYWIKSI